MNVSRDVCVAASYNYKLATELSVWGVHTVGNFINNDAKEKKWL